jgi:hypothetical protein
MISGVGWSQETSGDKETIESLEQQVKELQQHDREMQEHIQQLEAKQPPAATEPESPSTPGAAPAPEKQSAPASIPSMHDLHGIQWRGFAEVNYKILDQKTPETGTYGFVPGSAGNFYTGDFDLFLTSKLTDKTSVLADIDFEETDAQGFAVDARRILIKYDADDSLRFSFGRYQTSIGYYNWAFRSAAWLQTTADRPLVMEFAKNGGILPTQAIGVSVTGKIPSGRLGLNYIAEYGSADTIRPDINGDGLLNDENNGNHVNLGIFLTPDWLHGLRIGGSVYHDHISDLLLNGDDDEPVAVSTAEAGGSPTARWGQTIVNGHVVYVSGRTEFLSEGFLIRHALIGSSDVFDTPAFYAQFSKKFKAIRPFVRYQYVNASPRNVIFDDVGLRYGPSFGARYDLNDSLSFKAQLDHTARRGLPNLNGLQLELAAAF